MLMLFVNDIHSRPPCLNSNLEETLYVHCDIAIYATTEQPLIYSHGYCEELVFVSQLGVGEESVPGDPPLLATTCTWKHVSSSTVHLMYSTFNNAKCLRCG